MDIVDKSIKGILAIVEQIEPVDRRDRVKLALEKHQAFFLAPASSRKTHHGCFPGGLAVHTYQVIQTGCRLATALDYNNISSVLITCLFHDFGKTYAYELKDGQYSRKKELLPHSAMSIKMLADIGFTLTTEEHQAILMHNGLFTPMGEEVKNSECPLTLITHWADMWSCFVVGY